MTTKKNRFNTSKGLPEEIECNRCKEVKPLLTGFHRTSKKVKVGEDTLTYKYYHSICKDCRNKRRREYSKELTARQIVEVLENINNKEK